MKDWNEMVELSAQYHALKVLYKESQKKKLGASQDKLNASETKLDALETEVKDFSNGKPTQMTDVYKACMLEKNQAALNLQAHIKARKEKEKITQSKEKSLMNLKICPSPTLPNRLHPYGK